MKRPPLSLLAYLVFFFSMAVTGQDAQPVATAPAQTTSVAKKPKILTNEDFPAPRREKTDDTKAEPVRNDQPAGADQEVRKAEQEQKAKHFRQRAIELTTLIQNHETKITTLKTRLKKVKNGEVISTIPLVLVVPAPTNDATELTIAAGTDPGETEVDRLERAIKAETQKLIQANEDFYALMDEIRHAGLNIQQILPY